MDSRKEPRLETEQEVTVTLLGTPEIALAGRVVNLSGKGLCLATGRELPPGGALKVELADCLLLGEVVYSRAVEGGYLVGVALEQALYHKDLATLSDWLLGRSTKGEVTT